MELLYISEWAHECLLDYLDINDLSHLSSTSTRMNDIVYSFAVKSLAKHCTRHQANYTINSSSSSSSSSNNNLLCSCCYCSFGFDEDDIKNKSNINVVDIEQKQQKNNSPAVEEKGDRITRYMNRMNPVRAMRYQSRFIDQQQLNLSGCKSFACGERHLVVSLASVMDAKHYGVSSDKSNIGLTLACGSTSNNLLGVPLAKEDDSQLLLTLCGPSAYSDKRSEAVAVSKEHTICIERGGRAVWVWGGKFNKIERIAIDNIIEDDNNEPNGISRRIIGIGAGAYSFSACLLNDGNVYCIHAIDVEQGYYDDDGILRSKRLMMKKMNISDFKAKSISVSGTCLAIITVDDEVVIFTINKDGNALMTARDIEAFGNEQDPFDENVPLYYVVKRTELSLSSSNRLKVQSICAAERYIGIVTEDGKLYHVGASPLRFGSLSLASMNQEYGNASNAPKQVIGGGLESERICQVSCGPLHTLALTVTGKVYAWGFNGSGRLGIGHENDVHRPTMIDLSRYCISHQSCIKHCSNCPRVISVSAGYHHSAILLDSGKLLTFGGIGSDGRLGHNNYSFMSQCCLEPSPVLANSSGNLVKCEFMAASKSLMDPNKSFAMYSIFALRIAIIILFNVRVISSIFDVCVNGLKNLCASVWKHVRGD